MHRVLLRASIYANSAKKMMTGTAQLWQELLYEEGCTALNILFELGRTTESLRIALVNAVGEIERPLLAQYISPSNLPVSSLMKGEYGVDGISLSVPAVVGSAGVECHVPIFLNRKELGRLQQSAASIRKTAALEGIIK